MGAFAELHITTDPSKSIDSTLCMRYVVKKVIKQGKVYQLVRVKDTNDGDMKIVRIISRCHVSDKEMESEVNWLREIGPARRHAELFVEHRDLLYFYLVFKKSPMTLRNLLADTSTHLSERHIREISYQMVLLVRSLHLDRLSHRDICPENIEILNAERVDETYLNIQTATFHSRKVLKSTKIRLAFYGRVGFSEAYGAGTEQYRSPEVVFNVFPNRGSDVFSLGCVIAELLRRTPLLPYCPNDSFYKRNKAVVFDAVLGPFPESLASRIRGSLNEGIFTYERFTGTTIRGPISQVMQDFRECASDLKTLFPNETTLDIIEVMTKLDNEERIELHDLVGHPFFEGSD